MRFSEGDHKGISEKPARERQAPAASVAKEEPIKPTVTGGTIPAVFSVTDDTGVTVKRQIEFTVDRHPARVQAAPNGSKAGSIEGPSRGARARE